MTKIAAVFLLFFVFISCKKEPTTWQTDWSAPIAHGHLTLSDLIPAEYLEVNSANYYSIVYHKPVYTFTIDTLIDLPDTTIIKKSAVAVSSLTVNPGFSYTDTYDQEYQLDQIELKKVRIASGNIEVQVSCPWQGASLITFTFPKITYNSVPFERIYALPSSSQASPATVQETIDLANYMMDMTGTSGNLINYLGAVFEMGSNETANTFYVSNTDSISYILSFKDLKPDYAKGYFGQYHFSDTVGIGLDFMKNITAGQIDLDSIDMTLTIKNGFNLIAQTKITDLKGMNTKNVSFVDLNFPLDNTSMNINPASGGLYNYTPSEFPIVINSSNSNIIPFIENMNDSILLGYELDINPFGNITAGSDEVFPGSAFELFLDAEFPLHFGANDLTLVDTFEFSYDNNETAYPEEGVLSLIYSNGFPLEANAFFVLLDAAGTILDTLESSEIINSGAYNNTTFLTSPASGELVIALSSDDIAQIDLANRVVLHVVFSSDQSLPVKINSDAYFDFVLKSNIKLNIKL